MTNTSKSVKTMIKKSSVIITLVKEMTFTFTYVSFAKYLLLILKLLVMLSIIALLRQVQKKPNIILLPITQTT